MLSGQGFGADRQVGEGGLEGIEFAGGPSGRVGGQCPQRGQLLLHGAAQVEVGGIIELRQAARGQAVGMDRRGEIVGQGQSLGADAEQQFGLVQAQGLVGVGGLRGGAFEGLFQQRRAVADSEQLLAQNSQGRGVVALAA